MPTESMQIYQDKLNEEQAKGVLWLWERAKAHPVISLLVAVAVICVVLCVVLRIIIPWIIQYCQQHGIKKDSIPPSEHLKKKIRRSEVQNKRISILPAPAVDPRFCDLTLHDNLIDLAQKIENAESCHRTRCCVVCQNAELAENYARMFYHRMENAASLNHYGWVYYKEPKDMNLELCIESCFFESLRIFNEIELPEKRFIRQVDFLDQPNMHTLLVLRKMQNASKPDDKLLQIAALKGLSIVLFSTEEVPGYHTIEIPQEGGRNECASGN